MNVPAQIAKHFRDVYFGGNWTSSNLKEQLAHVSWQEATTQVYSLNTIATLVYHMTYYLAVVARVLEGGPLQGKDKESFEHPPVQSPEDWNTLLDKTWREAEEFAALVEQLPESRLEQDFSDAKYGNYYRNLHGIIEHLHYHLGQIVVIKKILQQQKQD